MRTLRVIRWWLRLALAGLSCVVAANERIVAQSWQELCGRSRAGVLARRQAARDASADSLVLLVASHPDDRYILPAVWLRQQCGYRVAVLLATRGGGAQNSLGPETGDALERIRTLETEACCRLCGADVWYLGRPDAGYRRSAEETFAEWGREQSLQDLVRLLRRIRPDALLTTHHAEEAHGHDLAVVELLEEAMAVVADPEFDAPGEPHEIPVFLLGAGSTRTPNAIAIDAERLDLERGASLRRVAYDILTGTHRSPGHPNAIDAVFPPVLWFEPRRPQSIGIDGPRALGLPSLFDADLWPGEPARAAALDRLLRSELPARLEAGRDVLDEAVAICRELRAIRDGVAVTDRASRAIDVRLARRIEALERLIVCLAEVQIEVEPSAGAIAVGGEEFAASVRLLTGRVAAPPLRVEGMHGIEAQMSSPEALPAPASSQHASLTVRVPLAPRGDADPMARRFHADRFEPPVQLRFHVGIGGIEVPVEVTVPVLQRPAVELAVVPRMLLLPSARQDVQFSVAVTRNSSFPIDETLEVRAPAGYAVRDHRRHLLMREQRSDLFRFEVAAPPDRRSGVDVLRVNLGGTRVTLPVHKIDVVVPEGLHIGLLRSLDDTLPSVLGLGGLGIQWAELTDADIAASDLGGFDTIVVDIRALRDRPAARSGFGRLLEFAAEPGHRLLLFYQKTGEFHPEGEAFRGAPFEPFEVGRSRVTRADAPVAVLRPEHVLLTQPNTIRPGDWDGWVQERALYLPAVYAREFEEVLELHDPGRPMERGALLYARTGGGEYVYCALALWRQLKTLHPGAVRLLVNLLTPARR